MLDFLSISTRPTKNGTEICPTFKVYPKSQDLMIRGGDFYAIWNEQEGLWSTDENVALYLIDQELKAYIKDLPNMPDSGLTIKYMQNSDSGMVDKFHKFCQKQLRDSYRMLDEELIFANTETKREHYASKKLNYPLAPGSIDAFDKLIGTLYAPSERHKLEWAIGSIVSGDSKFIQKFMVLYGAAGTGKSTILNIIQQLFDGYYCVFDAKSLGSANSAFALEAFKDNPLVAIQHDGDLSRIEDNTRLNSLVSHEKMTINEKFKAQYTNSFKCFLFMGTNRPVKITDAKSGLIRRLIDVTPSGDKVSAKEYRVLTKQVGFELGAIAYHCLQVYKASPDCYDGYVPKSMMGASNDFYNFIAENYSVFLKQNGTTLESAWAMWKQYVEDAKVPYQSSKRLFKEELKNYFKEFHDKYTTEDGTRLRNYYHDFKTSIFEDDQDTEKSVSAPELKLIDFNSTTSIFDTECADCLAQYPNEKGTPKNVWDKAKTRLRDLDTHKLHYVKVPENHIVIDFDIKDEEGNKSFEKNLIEASKWPPTYAELSKSGGGIHLHYIYTGPDASKLSRIYADDIEVKVFTGGSSLRRKLTKCNDLPIATINSGLPLKEEKTMINFDGVMNEKALRTIIKRHLNKEIMGYTTPSVQMIKKTLDQAYASGASYDVSDMRNAIYALAISSNNGANECIKLVGEMKFKSEEPPSEEIANSGKEEDPLVFFDIEVFPNLFLVCYKLEGEGIPVIRLVNPKPSDIEDLLKFKLVGFNNREYDNHMIYAAMMGYDNKQLYNLSKRLINQDKTISRNARFGAAYNISYTDILDFASAGNKKSLKKLEIEMGIHHQELGLPWDEPVDPKLWDKVGDYCENDVIATEAAFKHLSGDWTSRQILADVADMTVNDTTNTLTTRIILENNRKPQGEFNYRNLAEPVTELDPETMEFLQKAAPEMMAQKHGEANSLLPYFPGYKYEFGKSTYRDVNPDNPNPECRCVGEGGYVYAEPGMYGNVALLDVASMHPHSVIAEALFGVRYTKRFKDLVDGRVYIKHKDWDSLNQILDGKLVPYTEKILNGEMSAKALSTGLKTPINSVYGLTKTAYDQPFKDPRNKDNIVAKRGALFMIDLRIAVQNLGYTVIHCKTDSIKIADATPEIIEFVMNFGKRYGYTFEHEATYDRMCLVNKAVYIAKYATAEKCQELYGYVPGDNEEHGGGWTATGKQFAVPYVYKTLFSKEPIGLNDMLECFSVKSAIYLDMNENLEDVSGYEKELKKLEEKYKKGLLSDTTFEAETARLKPLIDAGHNYRFVGKVGEFCPVKPNSGGGVLYRDQNGKYDAVQNTTGYRWMESELIRSVGNTDIVDRSYYNKLVDDAVDIISKYGDFEWFVSDDPYIPKAKPVKLADFMTIPDGTPEELPFL